MMVNLFIVLNESAWVEVLSTSDKLQSPEDKVPYWRDPIGTEERRRYVQNRPEALVLTLESWMTDLLNQHGSHVGWVGGTYISSSNSSANAPGKVAGRRAAIAAVKRLTEHAALMRVLREIDPVVCLVHSGGFDAGPAFKLLEEVFGEFAVHELRPDRLDAALAGGRTAPYISVEDRRFLRDFAAAHLTEEALEPKRRAERWATMELPAPTPDGPTVWPMDWFPGLGTDAMLYYALDARAQLGFERYGQMLHRDDGRPQGVDALQEALDLFFYLGKEKMRAINDGDHGRAERLTEMLTLTKRVAQGCIALCKEGER